MRPARATDGKAVLRFSSGLEIRVGNLLSAAALLVTAVLLAIVSLGSGATDAGLLQLLQSIAGEPASADQAYALWTVRLPRIVMGFMAGWAVALAGAMLQSITRNPLADPGLLGLSQGSMTTIMLLLVLAPAAPKVAIAVAAFAGGPEIRLGLLWLGGGGRRRRRWMPGVCRGDDEGLWFDRAHPLCYTPPETSLALADWMSGSLFQANWSAIGTFAPLFFASLLGLFLLGRATSAHDLGAELARSLGEPVRRSRPLLLIFAVLLSSSAVTAVRPLTLFPLPAPRPPGFLSPARRRAPPFPPAAAGGNLVRGGPAPRPPLAGDPAPPPRPGLAPDGSAAFRPSPRAAPGRA